MPAHCMSSKTKKRYFLVVFCHEKVIITNKNNKVSLPNANKQQ